MQEPPSTQAGRSPPRGAAGSHPELGGGHGGDPGLELAASRPLFGGARHLGGLTQMCYACAWESGGVRGVSFQDMVARRAMRSGWTPHGASDF